MYKALNIFYDRKNYMSKETFEYREAPVIYKGFDLFKCISECHIVKEGKVVGMCVTINGCKTRIDKEEKIFNERICI